MRPYARLSFCGKLITPSCDVTPRARRESDALLKRPNLGLVYTAVSGVVASRS
jgi:hypothetical protein